ETLVVFLAELHIVGIGGLGALGACDHFERARKREALGFGRCAHRCVLPVDVPDEIYPGGDITTTIRRYPCAVSAAKRRTRSSVSPNKASNSSRRLRCSARLLTVPFSVSSPAAAEGGASTSMAATMRLELPVPVEAISARRC